MMPKRLSSFQGADNSLKQYQSTPHLDTFRHTPLTFSTFTNQRIPMNSGILYRDDPNPYKVSNIDELRIQVHDPYRSVHRSSSHLPCNEENLSNGNEYGHVGYFNKIKNNEGYDVNVNVNQKYNYYSEGEGDGEGEYELPDPDYEGDLCSSNGSEDLPNVPLALSSSEGGYAMSINSTTTTSNSTNSDETDRGGVPLSLSTDSPSPTKIKISEEDRTKIEHALRGRKTSIFVADSLANLYVINKNSPPRPNSTGSNGSSGSSNSSGVNNNGNIDWVLKYTGVPVLLLDTGETKSRDKRKIQIVLAELGSGLALWKDIIDNLTAYKVAEGSNTFHTMHLSLDHRKIIGLSFDDEDTAEKFAERVDKLTSDFANISLSGAKGKGKGKKEKIKPTKYVKPKKTEISQPCCFQHISSLNAQDKTRFSSIQNCITSKNTIEKPTTTIIPLNGSTEISF